MRLEGLGKLKNPMTLSGIGPASFRLVAQYVNELCYWSLPRLMSTARALSNFHGRTDVPAELSIPPLNVQFFTPSFHRVDMTQLANPTS
jgi:hypothetical protein